MNIPEVKTSYEYVTELREHLENPLKLDLDQEELQKSQQRYKKHYDKKAKPLEVGEQVLILLLTNSYKLLTSYYWWRGPYIMESRVRANNYRIKIRSMTKKYHMNMLEKYIAREPKVDLVHTRINDDATTVDATTLYVLSSTSEPML